MHVKTQLLQSSSFLLRNYRVQQKRVAGVDLKQNFW